MVSAQVEVRINCEKTLNLPRGSLRNFFTELNMNFTPLPSNQLQLFCRLVKGLEFLAG